MTIVETRHGKLAGVSREGHLAFLGIPFAGDAGGEGRWRAPKPASSWPGIRTAVTTGYAARQTTHPIPGFAASGPQSEDCLSLNVFTPAADGQRRPVLFWIHGGGFTHGTGSEPLYDGGPLAVHGDVVVVTINYRLGAFGYLYGSQHLPGRGLTANAGQLDQVAALEWVRDNIEAFGGDPANVTIFGESAGAAAVGTLLAMPAAKGLFHKAILESGTGRASTPEAAARVTGMMMEESGLPPEEAEQLLTVGADRLLEAQTAVVAKARGAFGFAFGPVTDPATLPEAPLKAIANGAASGIPVMLGTNRDEVKLFAASVRREEIDDATLARRVAAALPNASPTDVNRATATFRGSRAAKGLPATNLDIQDAIESELRFHFNARRFAETQVRHQPNTFLYLFTYASPARGGSLGACHALELPFVFGALRAPTQDRFAGSGPDVERLSANMMDAWLAFARSGRPAHEGIGQWPAYNAGTRPTMVFDLEPGVQMDPLTEEREVVAGLA